MDKIPEANKQNASGIFLWLKYVNGRLITTPIENWKAQPTEGLDEVAIGYTNFTKLSGQSIYWVYKENGFWVMGGGPVGYGKLPPEILVGSSDQHIARSINFMPDLKLDDIKLGYWWPNESRRPIDE